MILNAIFGAISINAAITRVICANFSSYFGAIWFIAPIW